jgi:DNA mismatch repair ATPase MutL
MVAAHCTSKISSFEDLTTDRLQTFGFRGEALNALSRISELEIITKSANDVAATSVTFDRMGNVVKETTVAGNVGTTIRCRVLLD